MAREIDILEVALNNKVDILSAMSMLKPGDKVSIKEPSHYDQFLTGMDDPDRLTPEVAQQMYKQAAQIKSLYDNNIQYIKPDPDNAYLHKTIGFGANGYFDAIGSISKSPVTHSPFAEPGRVRSTKQDAYNKDYYYEPDPNDLGTYIKKQKQPGYMNSGTFIYDSDPEIQGGTALVKLDDGANTAGYEQFKSLWGNPDDFTRNLFLESLKTSVSAVPRLGASTASYMDGMSGFVNAKRDIFKPESKGKFDVYLNHIKAAIGEDAMTQKKLNEVLATGTETDKLKFFNFIEQQQPIAVRNNLKSMRMTDSWKARDERFNEMYNMFNALTSDTPIAYSQGAMHSVGSFLFTSATVLSDLGIQMAAGTLTGGLPGFAAFGGVGMLQAVGGFARELKDAGFDDDTIAYATAIATPIIMGTEAIAGSAWAFKKMPKDMIDDLAKDMASKYVKEAGERVIAKSPIEAMKMGMEGAKKMWQNPSFRKIVDNPLYAPILKAGPVEAIQENLEDLGYNTIKLAVERWTRPEYYGEQITTGIKDWGGEDGVFNGKQMLETALISAFASGIGGYMGSGLRGEFKQSYRDQMRGLAQSEFLAEQIAEGNSGLLFDMAKREAEKDMGAFGSKEDLLANLGVNDVVVPAESDKWNISDMKIGTKQQDGSTVITNMADLNAYQFLQRLQAMSDAAAAGGLNENSLNVKMLHEIVDVNGTLMSVNAVKVANKVAEAKKALDDYKATLDEDETKYTQEQKDKLKEHEDALVAANAQMDYYVKPEDGLKYSKAVNDQMKEFMATYQLADEKAKEYLGDKYDVKDNDTYKKVQEFWFKEIAASYSYRNMNELQGKLKMWMEETNQLREAAKKELEAKRTMEFKPTPESDDLFLSLEKATKELEAISSMEPMQALAAMRSFGTNELSDKLESLSKIIPPSVLNERITKFQDMYDQARERLTGVSTEMDSVVNAFQTYSQSEDPFEKALAEADDQVIMQAGEDIESGKDPFESISPKSPLKGLLDEYIKSHTPEEVEAFKKTFAAYASAQSGSEVSDADDIITGAYPILMPFRDDAARNDAYQREIDKIKPIEQLSEGIEVFLEEATEMAAEAKLIAKNPNKRSEKFGDMTAEQIEGTLQVFFDLIDGLKAGMRIGGRMVKSSRLSSHATGSEIGFLKNLADPKKQEQYQAQVDQFKKDYDTFYRDSGLAALKGINRSHHNRMLIVGNQVEMIKHLRGLEIMKDGKNIISDALYKELEAFKITQEMFGKNGEFDEKERAAITRAERALTHIAIELNRNREFLEKPENFDKMMAPVEQMLRAMNAPESIDTVSGNTSSTMTPYTGVYTKPGEKDSSTDTGVMRFMAASISFTEALNNMKLSDHQRVVVEEKVRTYTNFLLYAMSPLDIAEVDNTRNYLYENKMLMAPTSEQRQSANSVIGMLSGSRVIGLLQSFEQKVLDSIYPGKKKEGQSSITADNQGKVGAIESRFIRNGILIPGVYGAGKTEIVFREALVVLSQMKKKIGAIKFYVPSDSLKTSYMSMFNNIVPDAKNYLMHHDIDAMKPVTTPTVIVVDEGSLLSKARIAKLASLERESKGNLKIVVLADVNQMRPTEASESFGAFPEIITSMHKTIQLTEHFSSASDMIKKHADYWLRKVTEQRNVGTTDGLGTLTDLLLAYHEVHNGMKVGSEYLSSTEEVYNAFMASKNASKALVFYSKEEYHDMLAKHPELKAEEDAKRVFILKPEDGMVVQGLRAEEMYLVTDYKSILGVSPSRVATAIYTFIGRSSRFYAMNIGSQASLFNTKDKKKVPRIAAEASDVEIREAKKEKLRESVMAGIKRNLGTLFKGKKEDDFASGQTREGSPAPGAPAVVPGKTPPTPPDQPGETDFQEKLRKATKTGKVTLLDGRVIEYTGVPIDINDPKSKYRYSFDIGDGKRLSFDGYKGLQNKTINKRIQQAIDNHQAQLDGHDGLDELLDGEDDGLGKKPEGLPKIEVPGFSQAMMHKNTGGLYVNTAGIILPKGNVLSEEQREEYRALHTAIIQMHKVREIGRMVYKLHEEAYVTAEGGYMNAKNVVSVRLVLTPEERKELLMHLGLLARVLSREDSKWKDSAYARALTKLANGGLDLDNLLDVGMLSLPTLGAPKRGMSSKTFDKLDGITLEEGRKIIHDSFEKAINDAHGDADLTNLYISARDAQLELFALRYYLKHSETKELPAKLESTTYADGRPIAGVEYDMNNEPQLFSDLLDGRKHTGENPSYSARGNLVLRVQTHPDDKVGVPVAVRAGKLGERTNLKEKFSEDKETLRNMPTSKEPLGTSKQIHAMYSASMRMWRKMFLYQVLMNNRAYIQEHRKDLEKYITFHEDNGKYVLNPNGKTLAERNENIEHLLNSIDKLTDLYDAVIFTKNDDPASPHKFKIELDPNGAPLWTYATRVNSNGYYFKPEDGSWIDALPQNDGTEVQKAGKSKGSENISSKPIFESSEVDADSPMVDSGNSRKLLADMLGGRFSKFSSEFVDGFITEDHMKATGMMKNGRIYMSSFYGKTKMSTPFHETFHVVWNYLLDPKAKKEYEKLAQDKAKEATGKLLVGRDLEEWVARDFARVSVNKKKLSRWDRFVLWLKDLVNFVHNNRKGLDGLYDDIYYGRYKSAASKMKPGNTGVTMFEEAYDEQEEASITESAKEEEEPTEEDLDRIDRFNNLMDAFPSDRAAMDKYVRAAQLELINLSPLSGQSAFIPDANKAIARIRKESAAIAEEYGATEVLVIKGGEQTLTPIKDVPLTDYENIYMDDPDATLEENKSRAKAYMRYVHVHSNFDTILEHIMTDFSARTGRLSRGKVAEESFSWSSMNPETDGFNSMMKLHLSNIPVVSYKNGVLSYSMRDVRFVDYKMLNKLIKGVGVAAMERYIASGGRLDGRLASRMDFFLDELDKTILQDFNTAVNSDGSFQNAYAEALISFRTRFTASDITNKGRKTLGKYNMNNSKRKTFIEKLPTDHMESTNQTPANSLLSIAQGVASKLIRNEEVSKEERMRMEAINNFLTQFVNVTMSYQVNNNSRIGVKGNEEQGFEFTLTEFHSNLYDHVKSVMIDNMNSKFSNGLFVSPTLKKKFNERIHVDEDGNITMGFGRTHEQRSQRLILVKDSGKAKDGSARDYQFSSLGGDGITDKQGVKRTIDLLRKLNAVIGLGIGTQAFPERVVMNMLEATSWADLNKESLEQPFMQDAMKMYRTPQKYLAAFVANSIYAIQAQIDTHEVELTYQSSGGSTIQYKGNGTISKIAPELDKKMDEDRPAKESVGTLTYYTYDGEGNRIANHRQVHMNKDGGIPIGEARFTDALTELYSPRLPWMKNFMSNTGTLSALNSRNSNTNETLTKMGYGIPVPSQFYNVLNLIASESSAEMGIVTGVRLFRADGKPQQVLQQSNRFSALMKGGWNTVKGIKSKADVRLIPELAKKMADDKSKSGVKTPVTQSQEDALQEYYQSVIAKANKLASDPEFVKEVSKVYLNNETLMRMGSLGAYLHHVAAIQMGLRRNHDGKFANRDGYILGSDKDIESFKKENRLQYPDELIYESVLVNNDGAEIAPYFSKGKDHFLLLDHLTDMFGISREYGSFSHGTNKLTALDHTVSAMAAFANKLRTTTNRDQVIITPVMTISDTGRTYYMHTQARGDKPLLDFNQGFIAMNSMSMLTQVYSQVAKIDRRIDIAYNHYIDLLTRLNALYGKRGLVIQMPAKGEKRKAATILDKQAFIRMNESIIKTALDRLDDSTRREVMDFVRGSELDKLTEVQVTKDGFRIGTIASGIIPNWTEDDSHYSQANRDKIRAAIKSKKDAYKVLKDIFMKDYKHWVLEMQQLGMDDKVNPLMKHGQMNQAWKNGEPHSAMFAYYMATHVTNNALDDIMPSSMTFKDFNDKTKRIGTYGTPTIKLTTENSVTIDYSKWGIDEENDIAIEPSPIVMRTGSMGKRHKAINISDPLRSARLGTETKEGVMAADGLSWMNALMARMYHVSAGGKDYSVSGDGKMIKTLYTHHDPYKGTTTIVKHAAHMITGFDFMGNKAYYNMQMDMLREQDRILDKAALIGTPFEGFSWTDTFVNMMDNGMSFDEAMDALHEMMIDSQRHGDSVYDALSNSVIYGVNTLQTEKGNYAEYNEYDPEVDDRIPQHGLALMDMYMDDYHIILDSTQEADDSKKQSPPNQQEPFFGINGVLQGTLAEKYGANPSIAISTVKAKMYDAGMKKFMDDVSKIQIDGISGINFNQVDWTIEDLYGTYGEDIHYALAQYEEHVRMTTRRSLDRAKVPGVFVQMLSKNGITSQVPQMRSRIINSVRKEINRMAIKQAWTGMRVVQTTGAFSKIYTKKGDSLPYTREEAIMEVYGSMPSVSTMFSPEVEAKIAEQFDVSNLQDMRIENGETVPGQVIMPFAHAAKFGLEKGQTIKDLFGITDSKGKYHNIRSLTQRQILRLLKDSKGKISSVMANKAMANLKKAEKEVDMDSLAKEIFELKEAAHKAMFVYDNRVPSNRMGSGAIHEIAGFSDTGNIAYVPLGMTLMNDADFDIDQLTVYLKSINRDGKLSDEEVEDMNNEILDIIFQAYMAKENQENLFVESSIKTLKAVGEEQDSTPINANTPYAHVRTYNDNKSGADGIPIFANTLSAIAWLQVMSPEVLRYQHNPIIDRIMKNRDKKGIGSMVFRLGDWLQASLDNNKYNIFGRYGIMEEIIPVMGIMAAQGPETDMSEEDFFRYIKNFFMDPVVRKAILYAQKGSSVMFSRKEHSLYLSVVQEINTINKRINNNSYAAKMDMDQEIEEKKMLMLELKLAQTLDRQLPDIIEGAHRPYLQEHAIEDMVSWLSNNSLNDDNKPDFIEKTLSGIKRMHYEKMYTKVFSRDAETINIYAGDNQNAELSNFAIRPFTTNVEFDGGGQIKFQSVEQGFHYYKAMLANRMDIAEKVLKTTNGGSLKSLTNRRNMPMSEEQRSEWDSTSKGIMLDLMYDSYVQNPEAAEKLVATGDTIITHAQDNTRWKTDFPDVVMTVREKLKEEGFGKESNLPTGRNSPDNVLYREFLSQRGIMYSFQNRERDKQALPKLEKMRDLIITAEAVRGFSDNVSLRNGIPHNDWEFYRRTQSLERSFGVSLKKFVDTTDPSAFDLNDEQLDEYAEMILLRDNEALEIAVDEQWKYEALRDKIKAVRSAFNMPAVVKHMPMMHRYIEQMLKDSNMNGALFMLDSKSFDDTKLAMQDRMGIGNWRFAKDQAGFKNMILEYGIDQWFNSLSDDDAIVHLAFPLQSGNGFAYDTNSNEVYGLMDLRNVYTRQELSLRFPVFISAFDETFDSAAEMEAYFAAMVPPGKKNIYEGVSKAFFDASGIYTGNQFISMIREVGSTERKYVGLMHNTSNMTEEQRTVLADDFRKLPEGIRRLFSYNEVINNQLSYRKGSISDVMGLEPYRMGISRIMNANAKAIRSGKHPLLNDPELIDRWMDIMALKNGNTRYVKEANINNGDQPFYINSFIRAENRRRARKVNLKRNAETADYDRITLITNRAGFSSETNTVAVNIEVLSLSEGNNQEVKLNGSTTVVLNEPHSYERGTYMTDTGVLVEMTNTTINSYTISRLSEDEYQKKSEEHIEKVKAKHNRIIPISTKQADGSYGPTQNGTQYQEISMYATRPFTVPAGTVEGFDNDMQFDRLVDAIVYFRIALAKMLFRGDRRLLSGIKIDEKIEDPVMRYNMANKALDDRLRKHQNKDSVVQLRRDLDLNMSDIAKRLVKSSIFGNGSPMPLDSMTGTYLSTKHRFNESLRRYFRIEKQMDFSDMVYLGRSGTDEVFKSPVRIRKITTSDVYEGFVPPKDPGEIMSEEEYFLSNMPFFGNMDEVSQEDEAKEDNNECL